MAFSCRGMDGLSDFHAVLYPKTRKLPPSRDSLTILLQARGEEAAQGTTVDSRGAQAGLSLGPGHEIPHKMVIV